MNQRTRRGRPRSAELDTRILTITRDVLARAGYAALTMEDVASAAGVGKQTLYRRWPRKPLLVFDAVFGGAEAVAEMLPDTGSLAGDLTAVTAEQARVHTDPEVAELLRGLLADCLAEPALLEELRTRFVRPRLAALTHVTRRAADRGEVTSGTSPEFLAETVAGAMLAHATIFGGDTAAFGQRLANLVTAGAAGTTGAGGATSDASGGDGHV